MSPRQGGDSYPSGTPPYGMPGDAAFSRAGQPPQAGRPTPGDSSDRDEPRTETTLTTRIKINIPGSRPIPEVVVRSPLNEETGEQPTPRRRRADTSGSPVLGVMESGPRTGTPPDLPPEWLAPEEPAAGPSASEWFAPRKKAPSTDAPASPQAAAPAPAPAQPLFQERPPAGSGLPDPQAPGHPAPGQQTPGYEAPGYETPGYPAPGPSGQAPAGYDLPYGSGRDAMPDSYGSGAAWTSPSAQPHTQQPQAPQSTEATQPMPAVQPGPAAPGQQAPATQPQQTLPPRPVPGSRGARRQPAAGDGFAGGIAPDALGAAGGQPTLQFRPPADPLTDPQAGFAQAAGGTATMPGLGGPTIATPASGGPASGAFPGGPGGQPGGQPGGTRRAGKGGKPAGKAGAKGGGSASGQTATLPVPRPQAIADGFAGGTGGVGSEPRPEPTGGGTGTGASTAPASGGKRGGGKARKLVGTAVGALVLAGAGAYGAGLMLNQADVPKGTTVLGYSIGGDTRDQAVTALTQTLGPVASRPLKVTIGGRAATLNPSVAGLTIDTGATVDSVAHHDYNPVTVIESLFGHDQAVAPVVAIDQDKLRSALEQLSAGGGAADASIHFTETGKVEVTAPKAGSGLDVDAAIPLVEQAFKARATGGADTTVALTVTSVQPKGSSAAADEAARTLGAWAMKQQFHVLAGGHPVPFGKGTFSQALTLRPDASGTFVPVFNLAKLKAAYGTAFDGLHTKGGTPVTPQDVAAALVSLLSKPDGPTSVAI